MQTSIMKRWAILGLLILTSIAFVGCGKKDERSIANPAVKTIPIALENSIPDDKLDEVLAAHYKGVAAMEQYDYGEAYTQFQTVHRLAPGWLPGTINLGIATLNAAGVIVEKAKAGKADAAEAGNLNQEALELFAEVLKRDPKNCYAHYCRGLILNQEGRLPETHREFVAVTEIDPNDAHAWYWRGVTVTDTDENDKPTKINIPRGAGSLFYQGARTQSFSYLRRLSLGRRQRAASSIEITKRAPRALEQNQSRTQRGRAGGSLRHRLRRHGPLRDSHRPARFANLASEQNSLRRVSIHRRTLP